MGVRAARRTERRGRWSLLLRVVTGRVVSDRLASVKQSLERTYVPVAYALDGLERYLIGTRPSDAPEGGHRIAFMTLWRDLEAATIALAGQLSSPRVLDNLDHGEVLDHVDYYEVDIMAARRSPGPSRYLRLTAGQVSRGLDADIQRELRARLGELGPEAVDAYVGRRVAGQAVEIAFVSTWTDAAVADRLRQPVWPEISSQYDVFWIELYDVLLEGSTGR
jgi:hypothetical protein